MAGAWITIGGTKGDDGKRHGGSPVFIVNGRIVKGHPSLTGKRIDALSEEEEAPPELTGTKRQKAGQLAARSRKENLASAGYARAKAAKEAKAQGVDPKHLHQLAAEMLAHDRELVAERTAMLREARKALEEWGGHHKLIQTGHVEQGDIRGMDQVGEHMAAKYPHLFDERHGHVSDQMHDLLIAGNPHAMTEEEAYTQALDTLLTYKHDQEEEEVPEPGSDIYGDPPSPSERVQGRLYGFGSKLEGKVNYGVSRKADTLYKPNRRARDDVPFSLERGQTQKRNRLWRLAAWTNELMGRALEQTEDVDLARRCVELALAEQPEPGPHDLDAYSPEALDPPEAPDGWKPSDIKAALSIIDDAIARNRKTIHLPYGVLFAADPGRRR